MSTILKALEKVEEEERLGRTPGKAEPGPPPESAAPAEPAPQEERRLPWRGALVGIAVVTFTLGLVWLWTPGQAEQEVAQALPTEAQPARRASAEPTETAAVRSDPAETVPAGSIRNDPDELADSIATRLAAAVPDEPSASSISPPPAGEPPPLAVAAEIQPTAEGPVASLPAVLPADPPPAEPDPTPVAPPPAANVASAPPQARVEPSPKTTPPTARPEPAPKALPVNPRPTRVVTIPQAPTVYVARTVWHPNPDRRSARVEVEGFVEPLELKEGDAVGVLVVAEIQPSAVVFLHGGARLRHPVGK